MAKRPIRIKISSISGRTRSRFRRRSRVRRLPRRYRKPNHWHQVDDLTFSKIVIRDVELMWLQESAPEAKVTWEKVHNCESMPLFKEGKWDGYATFVRFPKDKLHNAIMFRVLWWNNAI